MRDDQKRVIELLDSATPKENLRKWKHGYIPEHYRRISIGMAEAVRLACVGYASLNAHFGTTPYFTQSVIAGACITRAYENIHICTTSRYGKSWLMGQLALELAFGGDDCFIAGGSAKTANIIMKETHKHVQTMAPEMKHDILNPPDKLARMRTSTSKNRLAFAHGGAVEPLSLGSSFTGDTHSNNQAIGEGGHTILDEADLAKPNEVAELGRRQFDSDGDEKLIGIQISNPHDGGMFWDSLTADEVPDNTLLIWMDVRTAFEEGRIKSKDQVMSSDFFKVSSTCTRYLLCEMEDYNVKKFFPPPEIELEAPQSDFKTYLGIDSAYTGKDGLRAVIGYIKPTGVFVGYKCIKIDTSDWVLGETSYEIIDELTRIALRYNICGMAVDVGWGVWLAEGLAKNGLKYGFNVYDIHFGSAPTPERKKREHYTALYATNKRTEMHMDLAELMENKKATFTESMAELLKDQLKSVKRVKKERNKIAIIPKDEIKQSLGKSPDELDATILCLHALILDNLNPEVYVYQ